MKRQDENLTREMFAEYFSTPTKNCSRKAEIPSFRIVKFEPITYENARQIAALHISGISTGFISSLGMDFVTTLYQAITQSEHSFGFVAEHEGKVLGFAAFTADIARLYKAVLPGVGMKFLFLLAGSLLSWGRIRNAFETLFYPSRTRKLNLPCAEVLSIVVAENSRGRGIGTELVRKGLKECADRGIEKVKVLVDAENKPAERLYLCCGFELAGQINNHGLRSNIYVAEIKSQAPKENRAEKTGPCGS